MQDELQNLSPIQPSTPRLPNILCIEDEHFIAELYARALTKAGYNMTVALDGQQGLDLALTNNYDVILLDLMVPSITGVEILKRLRDPSLNPPIKARILITTNLEQRDSMREEIEKNADGYIIKAEITPRELVEIINNLA
jgi:DNA-binding response OmpR family regulator